MAQAMIEVLFFGRVREELGCERLQQAWDPDIADLDALQAAIIEQRGERWREVLGQENMVRAVNQQVAQGNPILADGDEIAFFPPVTGG